MTCTARGGSPSKPAGLLLSVFLWWLLPTSAQAAIILDVVVDAYVEDFPRDGVPDNVLDTNSLILDRVTVTTQQFGTVEIEGRPVMAFDLSPYSGQFLTSAIFSAYGTTTRYGAAEPADPLTADLLAFAGDGVIDLADFNRPGAWANSVTIPGAAVPTLLPPIRIPMEFFDTDVTNAVQAWLTAGTAFGEFRLESDQETFFALLAAGQVPLPFSPEPFPGPRLALTFAGSSPTIPEPASLWLMGLGFVALRSHRRHRA